MGALRDQGLWSETSTGKHSRFRPLPFAPDGQSIPDLEHYIHGRYSSKWEYRDAKNRLVGAACRFDKPDGGKAVVSMTWCHDDANPGQYSWQYKGFANPRPVYGADLIEQSPRDWTIVVVEGEKTCEAARALLPHCIVITWANGSASLNKTDWSQLKGRRVVLWPDADEPGLKAMVKLAELLISEGAESVSIVNLPDELPKGWDLADPVPEGFTIDPSLIVATAKQHTPSGDLVVDELNRSYALTIMGEKAVVIWERMEPVRGRVIPTYTSPHAVRTMMSNRTVTVGKREVNVFDHWMAHEGRRSYDGIVFDPGNDVPGYYNLWRGFTCVPDANGDWSILQEHIRQNVAQGNESLERWVLAWFAQMMQQPGEKVGTSLAMRGKQGVGKTVVGQHVGRLIRDNYVYVDDPRYVLGNFNSHMAHALLLQADEGFFAGDPRHTGRLKGLVTSETNRIEPKGKESFEIQNSMRLLVTSNMDWIVPTSFEERRFAIVDVGEGRMQDRAYFKRMRDQMEDGGYEGFLHYLLNMDLSTIDVGVIPKTVALMDQKEHSFDPVMRYWFERLRDGAIMTRSTTWERFVSSEALYQDFIERCHTWGVYRRPSDTQFIRDLEQVTPDKSFRRVKRSVETMTDAGYTQTRRAWCNEVPDLEEARRVFAERVGFTPDWPVDGRPSSATPIDREGDEELKL